MVEEKTVLGVVLVEKQVGVIKEGRLVPATA
jgi:hypothetical protein